MVIPHPIPEVNFLMVEIPTPKPYIFMIRVNRQIKCPKSWGPGSSPSPTGSFLRIKHISETILSILTKLCPNVPWVILFQSYVRYVWGPKNGPRRGLKWLIILIFKNLLLVNQQCQKIVTWHIALINLENRNPVWPNDFDLQLGCCISDAFSICLPTLERRNKLEIQLCAIYAATDMSPSWSHGLTSGFCGSSCCPRFWLFVVALFKWSFIVFLSESVGIFSFVFWILHVPVSSSDDNGLRV